MCSYNGNTHTYMKTTPALSNVAGKDSVVCAGGPAVQITHHFLCIVVASHSCSKSASTVSGCCHYTSDDSLQATRLHP